MGIARCLGALSPAFSDSPRRWGGHRSAHSGPACRVSRRPFQAAFRSRISRTFRFLHGNRFLFQDCTNWAGDRPNWHSRCVIAATFASVSLLSTPARAQQDPWAARARALSDTPLASFQGVNCVSIHAPRSIVWRLLVAPEYAAAWFFADSPKLKPRGAHYKKGPTAEKGDVLSLEATTSEGPRHLDLSVIVAAPPDMLSFLVRSDEADILDRGIEQVSFTFGLESLPNGVTDLYLASHYDSNSPFSAILSPEVARQQRERRLAILEMFRLLAEEAARLTDPPLHDVPVAEVARTPRAPRK
jgi:uncharacterized protein YndB with AHSA1/START domain